MSSYHLSPSPIQSLCQHRMRLVPGRIDRTVEVQSGGVKVEVWARQREGGDNNFWNVCSLNLTALAKTSTNYFFYSTA